MLLLVVVLLVEQVLAYSASYHPAQSRPALGGGTALMFAHAAGPGARPARPTTSSSWQSFTERWHYLLLAVVCAAVVAFVGYMYRRDSVELRPGVGVLLLALRLVALVGLLAYFLELEKRTERKVVHNSRAIVLVDTSLSMGLHDSDSSSVPRHSPNRLEQVVAVLDAGGLIRQVCARTTT